MKLVLSFFLTVLLFAPVYLSSQPTLTLPRIELDHIIGVEYSVAVKDFTDISKMEFVFLYDGNTVSTSNQLFFYPNNNFGASWEKVIYADSIKITMTAPAENGLTLPDDTNLFIGVFSFIKEELGQAVAMKISNSTKVYRNIGGEEIEIGYIPQEGFFSVKAPGSFYPRRVGDIELLCEDLSFENYNIQGDYVDVFQTPTGEDSIRLLEVNISSFQSITCPPNDTITIPIGFTHIALKQPNTNRMEQLTLPVVNPLICFSEVETIQTGVPQTESVFGLGDNILLSTYKNQRIEANCSYTVHVKEGPVIEELPNFSMSDIEVAEGTSFCIDVTAANFQRAISFNLLTNWDSTAFEFIETTFPPIYNNNPPLYNFTAPNIVIFNWITLDFINGLSLPDNTLVYSLCFKAKKTGSFPINFFSPTKNLSKNEIVVFKENGDGGVSEMWLKSATINVIERPACNVITTMEAIQICQGENYILNNQAYNQTGNYETTFITPDGCDSIVQLSLEVLPVPTAITDTFNTKENEAFIFNITQNDVLPTDINWQTTIITPPHVGKLINLGNGQFSYEPRFSYTGSTTFEYQICNEVCLPEGCTTTEVVVNIQGKQLGIDIEPTPLPQPSISQTSKIQLPNPSLQEGELIIFNIYGQQIENKYFFNDAPQQLWHLQQNELPAGIYFYVKRAKGSKKIVESGKIMAIGR